MAERPRIVVVGLGPAGPELIDRATLDDLESIPRRFLRTRRHPAASVLESDTSFDDVYDRAATLDEVYVTIVDELVGSAERHGEVLYAVPGSPLVAERTVQLLRRDSRVVVEIRPALSFLDLVWNRLGVDPIVAGARLVDGHHFGVDAAGERGPLVVAQCDSSAVLSNVKLSLGDAATSPHQEDLSVTVLQRLALPDERVYDVVWSELDRVEPDHLTSLWIPVHASPVAQEVARFAELVATLRRECPWDREQTHESLERHLVEETYEVLDAIENLDPARVETYVHLEEELGDLLFQIVFHATLAAEEGQFGLADVARTVHEKLYARHPHVFGEVEVAGADEVVRNWEQIKKDEKGRASVFEGIPSGLPALLFALKVQKKAAALADGGLDVPAQPMVDDAVRAAWSKPDAETIGAVLFAATDLARRSGVDPEMALRAFTSRFRDQVMTFEQRAH